MDWADLATLDLSQFDVAGGKQKLATQLKDAVHNGMKSRRLQRIEPRTDYHIAVGFFYITNFGLSQDEIDEQFAIGKEVFGLPLQEKMRFRANLEQGDYNGYRPAGSAEIFPNMRDSTEMWNLFKYSEPLPRPLGQRRLHHFILETKSCNSPRIRAYTATDHQPIPSRD